MIWRQERVQVEAARMKVLLLTSSKSICSNLTNRRAQALNLINKISNSSYRQKEWFTKGLWIANILIIASRFASKNLSKAVSTHLIYQNKGPWTSIAYLIWIQCEDQCHANRIKIILPEILSWVHQICKLRSRIVKALTHQWRVQSSLLKLLKSTQKLLLRHKTVNREQVRTCHIPWKSAMKNKMTSKFSRQWLL